MLTPKLMYGMLTSHKVEFSTLTTDLYIEFTRSAVYIGVTVYKTKMASCESRHVTVNMFQQ